MSARKTEKSERPASGETLIARNKRARFEYEVLDKVEAGICLLGSEVKSLRNGDVSINEAFARPRDGELFLLNMNIKLYAQAGTRNHDPLRPRKLLLHKREVARLVGQVSERRLTMVPVTLYWKRGLAKVQLALVRGRRRYDKREAIKKREAQRDIQRATRLGRRL
jgi:SsrA-binding protein